MNISQIMKALNLENAESAAIAEDYEKFSLLLPDSPEEYILERYGLDLSSEYGGLPIKNPFGKGSGQLSLNTRQVKQDAQAGLGFVVLKTFIAEDADGGQSMSDWAIRETRMVTERIRDEDGQSGWTVTWKGRGWYDTFEDYLKFFDESLQIGTKFKTVVAPSCKYHLPSGSENFWRTGEYEFTTRKLLDVWEKHQIQNPMPIEKDFSPTLAGSDRAAQQTTISSWLKNVSRLIKEAAAPRKINVGLKMFNAISDDLFQLEMLREVHQAGADELPDFLIYANRLFNPDREFDGVRGVAYGGYALSKRNLKILAEFRCLKQANPGKFANLPISATGNVESGKMAVEYLLRGASSFQMHTFFQLPGSEYRMKGQNRTARALHELYFNPERGFIAWLLHLRRALNLPRGMNIKQLADFCVDPGNGLWCD